MDPNQQAAGRARGRGRGIYAHPVPHHAKDPQFVSIFFFSYLQTVFLLALQWT